MRLYETVAALAKLDELNDEEVGAFLDEVKLPLNDKVNNVVKFHQNMLANAEAIDHEIKRLAELKQSYAKKAESLKKYIEWSLQSNGIKKLETDIAKLSFRSSSQLEITDPTLIPKEFVTVKTVETPDKLAIKKAIKDGRTIDGVRLVENENLQIK